MRTSEVVSVLPEATEMHELHRSIRSWITPLILFGGISIISNGIFDPVWGIVMILIAILSWKNKIPGMFILYSVLMGWAAVDNTFSSILGGFQPWWLILSVFQAAWTVSIIKQYRKYCHIHPENETVILGRFGVASTILSALVLVLPPLIAIGVFVYYVSLGEAGIMDLSNQIDQLPEQLVNIVVFGLTDSAVLALGLGIAAIASGRQKGWGIAGTVMSSIILSGLLCVYFVGVISELVPQQGALSTGA